MSHGLSGKMAYLESSWGDFEDEDAMVESFKTKMAASGGYYSSVQRILNQMTPSLMAKFAALDTDIKRVVFAREIAFVEETFRVQRPSSPDRSEDEARRLRKGGNDLYVKKDYTRALDLYTRTVFMAPCSPGEQVDDQEFSLALANRSATLFQLEKYQLAMQDMILALQHGYPEELRFKLFDRMGKCFLKLNRADDAKYAFEKARKYLPTAQLTEAKRASWLETINESLQASSLDKATSGQPVMFDSGLPEPPATRKPLSAMFPCATDAFEVHYDDECGRYVTAKEAIKIGDVVLCEAACTVVLGKDHTSTHCFHCFKRLDVATPCFSCQVARFCGGLCRDAAWSGGHEHECPYLRDLHHAGVGNLAHLGLRVILATGLDKLLGKRTGDRHAGTKVLVDAKGCYVGGYEALLDMVGNSTLRNENEMFQYTLLAVYMLSLLKRSNFFSSAKHGLNERKPRTVENYVAGLLLRFLQIISCNGVDVMETCVSSTIQRARQNTLGLALYPTVALINHSCNPNLELVFYGNRVVARAIRSIAAGQQMCIDYGFVYYLSDLTKRSLGLRGQYFFDCHCAACTQQWPLKSRLPAGIPTLKCVHCAYPLSITDQSNTADPNSAKCRKCGRYLTPLAYLEEYYESSKLVDKALEEVRRGHTDSPARVLAQHLVVMEKYILLPVKEYVTCLSALKQCYRVMGNCFRTTTAIC